MRAALALVLVCLLAPGVAQASERIVLGRSVEHRPIVAYRLGDPAGRKVLIVGCVHGNECAGSTITSRLRSLRVPAGVDLWLLPEANPDGTAHDRRANAHGVDLNRQFPYRWRHLGGYTPSGPHPLSEPESRILHRLLLRLRPDLALWYHQDLAVVDRSGGYPVVERRYAELVGLPLRRLPRFPGSITSWTNVRLGGSSSVVELPAGPLGRREIGRHARAVVALERSVAHGLVSLQAVHGDARARSRSATRSSTSSSPTESRTWLSVIPTARRPSSPSRRCVVVAGCVINDFESPRLFEMSTSCNASSIANARSLAGRPPAASSNVTTVPPALIWPRASSCCGWDSRYGYLTQVTSGCASRRRAIARALALA